jgi:hypothetical protein
MIGFRRMVRRAHMRPISFKVFELDTHGVLEVVFRSKIVALKSLLRLGIGGEGGLEHCHAFLHFLFRGLTFVSVIIRDRQYGRWA